MQHGCATQALEVTPVCWVHQLQTQWPGCHPRHMSGVRSGASVGVKYRWKQGRHSGCGAAACITSQQTQAEPRNASPTQEKGINILSGRHSRDTCKGTAQLTIPPQDVSTRGPATKTVPGSTDLAGHVLPVGLRIEQQRLAGHTPQRNTLQQTQQHIQEPTHVCFTLLVGCVV